MRHKDRIQLQVWEDLVNATKKMSTCLTRQVGAVLLVDNRVVSTGYNGAPCGVTECISTGVCFRSKDYKTGHQLGKCIAVHAEVNCILNAAKHGITTKNSTLCCSNRPCLDCLKALVNSGVEHVIYIDEYEIPNDLAEIYQHIVNDSGIKISKMSQLLKNTVR